MASWVLAETGLKPLPLLPKARITRLSNPTLRPNFYYSPKTNLNAKVPSFICRSGASGRRDWALKVSAPPPVVPVIQKKEEAVGPEKKEMGEFDPGAPPPFTIGEIRAAIPKHCWVKDPWQSMTYVFRDLVAVFGLAAAAVYFNNWAAWPLYWAAQGTMFWALFVLGHDW